MFKIDWKIVRDIYSVGLPGIIMQSIGSFMHLGFNAIIAANATAVTILGIYFKLQSFIFLPVFGLNQGAMPIMGYNYGARNKARLMQTYRYALAAAVVIMSIGLAVFQLKPDLLLKLFSADEEMYTIGIPALRMISLCFLPAAYGIICSTTFQSTGHGMYSLFSSLIRQLVGILPIAYFLYNHYGVMWCWAAFPLAELLGTTYVTIMFIYLYRTEIRNL